VTEVLVSGPGMAVAGYDLVAGCLTVRPMCRNPEFSEYTYGKTFVCIEGEIQGFVRENYEQRNQHITARINQKHHND